MRNIIKFDLMRPLGGGNETFIATLKYPHKDIWKFDMQAFYDWVIEQRPSLRGKAINAYPEKPITLGKGIKLEVMHFRQDINKLIRQAR